MDKSKYSVSAIKISQRTTLEDLLNFNKKQLQDFLKTNKSKISGNKLTLAQRAHDVVIQSQRQGLGLGLDLSVGVNQQPSTPPPAAATETTPPPASSSAVCSTPAVNELQCGWTGKSDCLPRPHIKDIENYLLHSSHRTEDSGKMQCYRQYIRGLNFFKEGYIHKVMYNAISDESELCYVRSKCYPSMKKGVYEQWLLLSKQNPFRVEKAGCTCPAGFGEGCTHIAGLLFALEGRPATEAVDDMTDLPCTSKPCQWNRPNKRKKETRPIQDISFKRIKYEHTLKEKKKKVASYQVDNDSFRNTLCAKLGNSSRAAIFDILPPSHENIFEVECDLNVSHFEEIETSEHIHFSSDIFINLLSTVANEKMSQSDLLGFLSTCNKEIVDEIEVRTKGQHDNQLWVSARKARLTASVFHDIKTRKDTTRPDNIVSKVLGQSNSFDNSAVAWGRKNEPIAKKRYIAYKKLKENKRVNILECGLFLSCEETYIGASPDGLVICGSDNDPYLIEVKCPYRWRNASVLQACMDKDFCCHVDTNNIIQLKKNHRYYTQVQGQMGVCKKEKCDFVIYTIKDFVIIKIEFDKLFWDSLLQQLKKFYFCEIVPKLCS